MRVVIDTNVFISGLLGSITCRNIFLIFTKEKFELVISEVLFEELKFVIARPKLHLLIDSQEKEGVISFIKYRALFIKPKERVDICRDTKDNKILECALEANVNFIISLDNDLLSIKSFRGIPILSPKEFLLRLKR